LNKSVETGDVYTQPLATCNSQAMPDWPPHL